MSKCRGEAEGRQFDEYVDAIRSSSNSTHFNTADAYVSLGSQRQLAHVEAIMGVALTLLRAA